MHQGTREIAQTYSLLLWFCAKHGVGQATNNKLSTNQCSGAARVRGRHWAASLCPCSLQAEQTQRQSTHTHTQQGWKAYLGRHIMPVVQVVLLHVTCRRHDRGGGGATTTWLRLVCWQVQRWCRHALPAGRDHCLLKPSAHLQQQWQQQ